tara:strand:- start:72 stop:326 length:255 start_codon:yes stop_codon:yes gene_type:complete
MDAVKETPLTNCVKGKLIKMAMKEAKRVKAEQVRLEKLRTQAFDAEVNDTIATLKHKPSSFEASTTEEFERAKTQEEYYHGEND